MSFSWLQAHGAVTHFPVALVITALAFDAGAVILRRPRWHDAAFWMLVVGAALSIPALFTGWMTARSLFLPSGGAPVGFIPHWRFALASSTFAMLALAWRVATRNRAHGSRRMVALTLGGLAALGFGVTGYLGGDMAVGAGASVPVGGSERDVQLNRRAFPAALVERGYKLVVDPQVGCTRCHSLDGGGGGIGPDLSRAGLHQPNIAWQIEHLRNPRSVHPGSTMPAYDHLTPDEREAIAAWLVTRDGSKN